MSCAADRPLNLVMIGPYPEDPHRVQRGVEAVTVNLVEGLKHLPGIALQVISCKPHQAESSKDIDGVRVHFLSAARHLGNITLGAADRIRVQRRVEALSPDLVHNQYHFAYPYLFSKPPVPTVTTVHGISFKEAPYENEALDWVRRVPRLCLERLVLRNAEQVICVSSYVRETIAPLTRAKLYVVDNPVADRFFGAAQREIPNRLLFVGAITRRKNILDLLKAAAMLRDEAPLSLHVVGVVEEVYYFRALQDFVRANGLGDVVTFCGAITDAEVVREYEEAAVVVLPSFEESAGIVLEQAMAAGKPAVATRVGGIPCIVTDGVTGWLTRLGDVRELAQALRGLLGDERQRRLMGSAGREQAVRRFSNRGVAEATCAVYRAVLDGRWAA